jgi:hypothetical protein
MATVFRIRIGQRAVETLNKTANITAGVLFAWAAAMLILWWALS